MCRKVIHKKNYFLVSHLPIKSTNPFFHNLGSHLYLPIRTTYAINVIDIYSSILECTRPPRSSNKPTLAAMSALLKDMLTRIQLNHSTPLSPMGGDTSLSIATD